jgi:hypothetical protein
MSCSIEIRVRRIAKARSRTACSIVACCAAGGAIVADAAAAGFMAVTGRGLPAT